VGTAEPSWVATSPDGALLYVINANPRTNPLGSLMVLDIDASPASLRNSRDLAPGFSQAVVDPEGDHVYLAYGRFVQILDADDLHVVGRYDTPGDITSITADASSLYVAFGEAPGADELPRIERLDRSTMERVRTWRLVGLSRNLLVTGDGTRLYAYLTSPFAMMIGLDVR
jgi:DNA-binding beta-propeller fold protein YncE